MKYISDGTWFDKGSEIDLIDDYRPELNSGLFKGWRTCQKDIAENRKIGERYIDEEICSFDKFEVKP